MVMHLTLSNALTRILNFCIDLQEDWPGTYKGVILWRSIRTARARAIIELQAWHVASDTLEFGSGHSCKPGMQIFQLSSFYLV